MKTSLSHLLIAFTMSAFLAHGIGSAYAAPFLPQNDTLIYYHFDEGSGASTALDVSGKGRDGVYESNVTTGLPSAAGLGNSFAPSSSGDGRVLWQDASPYQDSDLYDFTQQSFTVDFWLWLDAGSVDGEGKVTFAETVTLLAIQPNDVNSASDFSVWIFGTSNTWHAGGLSVGNAINPDRAYSFLGLEWESEAWYHIAISFDADDDSWVFYRSAAGGGALLDPLTNTTSSGGMLSLLTDYHGDRQLSIGAQDGLSGPSACPGRIDEVRLATAAIPEPGAVFLSFVGSAAVFAWVRRRNGQC